MLASKALAAAEVSGDWDLANAFPLSKTFSFSVLAQDGGSTGVAFSPDGLSMYIVGTVTDTVYQYTLSTAWDITTASYASKSFSVASQETSPQDLFFKPDGQTMYVLGNTSDAVYQYTLGTAWDISTASYASKSFSVASQELGATGLFFKPDGLAMYIVGSGTDTVYQYTLGTAWDVSTASYASKSFSVAGQDTVFAGLFFKSDGTVMYVAGGSVNAPVFQYSLGTAWDVSTATYRARSSTLIAGGAADGMFIKGDGGILYIVNSGTDTVNQIPINDPWNISSATYDRVQFYTVAQGSDLVGIFLTSDGLSLYAITNASDTVHQYTLATAWQINTASYTGKSFSVTSQEANPYGLFFSSSGTAMFVVGRTADAVFQYTLATAWDVSTASYASKSFSVSGQEANTNGLFFKPDGLVMYIIGSTSDSVFQYTLGTAWDISTASYASKTVSVAAQDTVPQAVFFKSDGSVMYVLGSTGDNVYQYNLGTAWDISTASYASISLSVASIDVIPAGLFMDPTGTLLYIAGSGTNRIAQYTLPTAWSVANGQLLLTGLGSFYNSALVVTQDGSPQGIFFKPDGTQMYMVGSTSDSVFQYTLGTAWDISTVSYTGKSFSVATQETAPSGLFFKSDGLSMYVVGGNTDSVYQYTLSTAWDISTASYASKSFLVSGQDTLPADLFFKPDGLVMYVLGNTNDTVYQYTLGTAWDVSTASYASKSFSVVTQENGVGGLFFKPDGLAMYIIGTTNDTVYQYNLATAWDVSTASYSSISYSVAAFEGAPTGLAFNDVGARMYVVGSNSDTVYQFNTQ